MDGLLIIVTDWHNLWQCWQQPRRGDCSCSFGHNEYFVPNEWIGMEWRRMRLTRNLMNDWCWPTVLNFHHFDRIGVGQLEKINNCHFHWCVDPIEKNSCSIHWLLHHFHSSTGKNCARNWNFGLALMPFGPIHFDQGAHSKVKMWLRSLVAMHFCLKWANVGYKIVVHWQYDWRWSRTAFVVDFDGWWMLSHWHCHPMPHPHSHHCCLSWLIGEAAKQNWEMRGGGMNCYWRTRSPGSLISHKTK